MTAAEESNILVHAGEMAKHYAQLYNFCDWIQLREYYMEYIRTIAYMVSAVDDHITMHYKVTMNRQREIFTISKIYFKYDGELFGIPWNIKD